jgi:hypothetical protein
VRRFGEIKVASDWRPPGEDELATAIGTLGDVRSWEMFLQKVAIRMTPLRAVGIHRMRWSGGVQPTDGRQVEHRRLPGGVRLARGQHAVAADADAQRPIHAGSQVAQLS